MGCRAIDEASYPSLMGGHEGERHGGEMRNDGLIKVSVLGQKTHSERF